ncbi:MAG: molybdopterin-dependent oxidoreductase [Rhodobacterales bacterium]|nr:molybdopterin-dependent oxidoreductase [Rhodobacterales bacterium]
MTAIASGDIGKRRRRVDDRLVGVWLGGNCVEDGMNALDFVVVQDIFLNEICRFADVILPAACFAEKDGGFTNSDRRVQRARKAVNAPGDARADWEIICDISRACGYPMPWYNDSDDVYAEMAALTDQLAGITHE